MLSRDIAAKSFIFYETFSVIFLLAPPTSAPQQRKLHISLPSRADQKTNWRPSLQLAPHCVQQCYLFTSREKLGLLNISLPPKALRHAGTADERFRLLSSIPA